VPGDFVHVLFIEQTAVVRSHSSGELTMKFLIAAIAATFILAGPAFAEDTAPTTDTKAPTTQETPQSSDLTKSGKPKAKVVRKECREEANAQGLKGADKKKAIADCVIKARPDLAAGVECRQDPSLKGLDKDDRKARIKNLQIA
jgi:hypothetical protein